MSGPLLAAPASGGRLVWTGRHSDRVDGGLDGWNCSSVRLSSLLRDAAEVVVLDPLSFPWESPADRDFDAPFVVALPSGLDDVEIEALLSGPLLSGLTPFDRLIVGDIGTRDRLQARWGFDAGTWIVSASDSVEHVLDSLTERSGRRLVDVTTSFGVFRGQRDDLVTRHLEKFGAHQRGTLNVLLAILRADDVVVDIGAHIGTFAVPLAGRLSDEGHVVAIEGDPGAASLLRHNVSANGLDERVTIVEAVLGDRAGGSRQSRHVGGNTGGTSFVPSSWADRGAECTVLDLLAADFPTIGSVSVLKLDVEGAELAVLVGAGELIKRSRPVIVCEVSARQLERYDVPLERLDAWFADADYCVALIAGERNHSGGGWALEPLGRLTDCTDEHFDVLATPTESDRMTAIGLEGSVA